MADVSSVTNHFPTHKEGFVTTLSSTISAGATTIPLTTVSGLTNGDVFVGIVEPGEATEQVFTGTVDISGVQITNVVWTKGTNADHAAGSAVVDWVTSTSQNMQTKGILVEHNQDGTHNDITATNLTVNGSENAYTPVGSVLDYAGTTAPTGWLLCYGQAVSRTTYSALFTAISTTYGVGDGSTTFNLPDLRGRVIAGKDDMGGSSADRLTDQSGGLDGDVLGDTGGSETHTLTTAELAAHTHTGTRAITTAGLTAGGSSYTMVAGATSTGSTGSDSAHNNVQPTIILNKIIKY